MVELHLLDVYETACLAGGLDWVVDTAVVVLVESGRVRVQRTGELTVVEDRPGHEIEAAVLAAVGRRGWRQIELVRWRAGQDERLIALAERLRRDGLVSSNRLARRLGRVSRRLALTATGRRRLRELRADPPVRGVVTGTSAARVALGGVRHMPDREQRVAVFHPPRPRRVRSPRAWYGGGAVAGSYQGAYWAGGSDGGIQAVGGSHGGCAGGNGGGGGGCGGGGCGGG
jgi:hypothetical protein